MADPTLKLGSKGDFVEQAQLLLIGGGVEFPVTDGIFDAEMDQAVRRFQTAWGLPADGVIGSTTWKFLQSRTIDEPPNAGVVPPAPPAKTSTATYVGGGLLVVGVLWAIFG